MEQTTIDGLTQYLTELRIAGCGEITCRRIAEEFGDDTIEVCLDDWQRMTEIEGIGQRKALAVHDAAHSPQRLQSMDSMRALRCDIILIWYGHVLRHTPHFVQAKLSFII